MSKDYKTYEVVVENLGIVYKGESALETVIIYNEYVGQSKNDYGRAAGETVAVLEDGEIIMEHTPC